MRNVTTTSNLENKKESLAPNCGQQFHVDRPLGRLFDSVLQRHCLHLFVL